MSLVVSGSGIRPAPNYSLQNVTAMKDLQSELKAIYDHLAEAFGVYCGGWDMIHLRFSPSMYCPDNRLSLTAEYLTWKWFVQCAKQYNVVYYWGIDKFLEEYSSAIESRVQLD